MSDRNGANRLLASDDASRRHSSHFWLLAGGIASGMVALLALSFGLWFVFNSHDEEDRFPPKVLADYVPEDSAVVLAVDVSQLRDSPIAEQKLSPLLQQLNRRSERQLPWLNLLGIRPLDDFNNILISFGLDGAEPELLASGTLDRSRLQMGPRKLQEATLDHFRIWQYGDPDTKQTTYIAPVGDMLVVSEGRSRVQAALKQASDPQPILVRDATLRRLLAEVDRRQSLWLAASIKKLGPVSEIDNYLLKMVLRPLVAHAESVHGGIACAEDLRAELHFSAATEEDAAQLESDLKSICEAAPGIALLGRKNEMLPLLRLLAAAQIQREGKTILLRCRLTAEQTEPRP